MQEARYAFSTNKGYDEILESLTPKELPSHEEISQGCDDNIPFDEKDMWSEKLYFRVGAKWVIKQLKNQ